MERVLKLIKMALRGRVAEWSGALVFDVIRPLRGYEM